MHSNLGKYSRREVALDEEQCNGARFSGGVIMIRFVHHDWNLATCGDPTEQSTTYDSVLPRCVRAWKHELIYRCLREGLGLDIRYPTGAYSALISLYNQPLVRLHDHYAMQVGHRSPLVTHTGRP
jgi:hypothetical protein